MNARNLSDEPGDPTADAFPLLWALAALIGFAQDTVHHNWAYFLKPPLWAVVLCAGIVVLRSTPSRFFPLLLIAQLVRTWNEMPEICNHWLLASAVDLAILFSWRGLPGIGRKDSKAKSLFDGSAPIIRSLLLLTYVLAALHKLNRDFFSDT